MTPFDGRGRKGCGESIILSGDMGGACFKIDLDTGFKWQLANDRDVDPPEDA